MDEYADVVGQANGRVIGGAPPLEAPLVSRGRMGPSPAQREAVQGPAVGGPVVGGPTVQGPVVGGAMGRGPMVREMPAEDRPRERLARYGADVLASAELIAIVLRAGVAGHDVMSVAHRLLKEFGLAGLAQAPLAELETVPGVGPVKAMELKAAITLGVRAASVSPESRPLLKRPEDIADLMLHEMSLHDREHVRVVNLDVRLRLLKVSEVYVGSVHQAQVRYAELLRDAVRTGATAVVLVHNHPSGDPTPSAADIAITKGLVAAGELLDIEVQDHIVMGGGRYVSMRALRLGFGAAVAEQQATWELRGGNRRAATIEP